MEVFWAGTSNQRWSTYDTKYKIAVDNSSVECVHANKLVLHPEQRRVRFQADVGTHLVKIGIVHVLNEENWLKWPFWFGSLRGPARI